MPLSRRSFSKLSGLTAMSTGLAFTGKANYATAASQESAGPTLRFGINTSDMGTLDPHFAATTTDRAIVDMMFNGLIRFTPGDSGSFEPDLAEEMPSATENPDGTQTWSFTLRQGVMTHPAEGVDSYELTAEDVLFSYRKAADAGSSAYAGDYLDWTFAIGDDGTFQVTVPTPLSETLFLPKVANYSGGYIIPQAAYEAIGMDDFITNPVGTGPFAFESHTPQNNATLVAHADFYRGVPQLGGVEVRFIADTTSRELALQSGEIDMIYGLPETQWVDRMNGMDGITADVFGVGEVAIISLDTQHEVLGDPLVREAILLAMSRENHVALFGMPVAEPTYSVVPAQLMAGGLTQEEAAAAGVEFAQDIDRAKELLAEAGYPDGFELEVISSEREDLRRIHEVMAEELRQIGIDVKLEIVQHATAHELNREGRNPIVVYLAFRPTADHYLTQFFTSEGGPTNFSKFTVDDLRDQARAETDADAQAELWKQANIEILQNCAGTGLFLKNLVYAKTDRLDYGHELVSVVQLYPGIDETTSLAAE